MNLADLTARDKLLIVLGYTARLAMYKSAHKGYTPAEYARIVDAESQHRRALLELAAEATKGAP